MKTFSTVDCLSITLTSTYRTRIYASVPLVVASTYFPLSVSNPRISARLLYQKEECGLCGN